MYPVPGKYVSCSPGQTLLYTAVGQLRNEKSIRIAENMRMSIVGSLLREERCHQLPYILLPLGELMECTVGLLNVRTCTHI